MENEMNNLFQKPVYRLIAERKDKHQLLIGDPTEDLDSLKFLKLEMLKELENFKIDRTLLIYDSENKIVN